MDTFWDVSTSASRHRRTRPVIALAAALSIAGAACADDLADAPPPPSTTAGATETSAPTTTLMPKKEYDIVGTALNGPTFSQLAGMVVDAGLVEALRGGPFTVFAPTNDAFDKLPLDVLHSVQDDEALLATVLTYHVVEGEILAADLQEGELQTLAGIALQITRDGDQVLVNGNPVMAADVQATNGVIHVMGDVLVPPSN
jgi:uncharacterized surface protein with fasciclin (FAS1) repeats